MSTKEKLIEIRALKKMFVTQKSFNGKPIKAIKAVDGITLDIYKGETLGIVGESGCGKSTLGRTLLGLLPKTSGDVVYQKELISDYTPAEMRTMRQKMQIIFQDPYASLNPRMTVLELIKAPLDVFRIGTHDERLTKVKGMMELVGMRVEHMRRYPHEFSGGQRQRIVIARALILDPEFVVCDEPVSALDVSVRSQVLNLIKELQAQRKLTYLFISHDLSCIKYVSDRIAVMYLGRVVELADKEELYQNPQHPYTQALLSAIPVPDMTTKMKHIILSGDVPSPLNPPSGCHFHTRCPHAIEQCATQEVTLEEIAPKHFVSCHLVNSL